MGENSFVYWYSSLDRHLCGYCKNETGNISHGMWAQRLTCEDYQHLIDRGWRRSGNYCYKPLMQEICCPMYTIKCDSERFQLSKSQKKVIKKFNKYLNDGILNKFEAKDQESEGISEFVYRQAPEFLDETEKNAIECDKNDVESVKNVVVESTKVENIKQDIKKNVKSGIGADPNRPACKKAKILRLERKQAKLLKRGMSLEQLDVKNNTQKSLEEFLQVENGDNKHKLKLELVNTDRYDEQFETLKRIEFDVYKKYQMIIHNDPPTKCTMEAFVRFLIKSPLKITLERLDETHKYFKLTADLFQKYQIAIHNDNPTDCDHEQYTNFLLDTPLQYVKFSDDSNLGFGSFHQLYWLDDKLIAVGVIDILPKCVSAVYFFYDPDYRNLTLGTYGSLRELEFARMLHKQIPSIEYYYMGYYIHSCPKMRYKGKLTPSYLLCPETYTWVEIEKCIRKLEINKYARFNDDINATDTNNCSKRDIDNIKLLYRSSLVPFGSYKKKFPDKEEVFNTIARLIGRKCAKSLIFIADR